MKFICHTGVSIHRKCTLSQRHSYQSYEAIIVTKEVTVLSFSGYIAS